jgi:intraflagellar transport protein 172
MPFSNVLCLPQPFSFVWLLIQSNEPLAHYDPRRYRKELLAETHQHLASQLEADGNWRDAEKHYLDGNDWKGAVGMFRAQGMWDDALRVARAHGGANASKQVRGVGSRSDS